MSIGEVAVSADALVVQKYVSEDRNTTLIHASGFLFSVWVLSDERATRHTSRGETEVTSESPRQAWLAC